MDSRAQSLGFCRIFGSAVKVPDMRLVQRAKPTLLTIEDNDVLVLPVYHAYSTVPQRLVDAVVFQMLAERQSLAFTYRCSATPQAIARASSLVSVVRRARESSVQAPSGPL